MIPSSAVPTSPRPASCWDGSRRSIWKPACASRWITSKFSGVVIAARSSRLRSSRLGHRRSVICRPALVRRSMFAPMSEAKNRCPRRPGRGTSHPSLRHDTSVNVQVEHVHSNPFGSASCTSYLYVCGNSGGNPREVHAASDVECPLPDRRGAPPATATIVPAARGKYDHAPGACPAFPKYSVITDPGFPCRLDGRLVAAAF